jgi:rod shape determining protein RodA
MTRNVSFRDFDWVLLGLVMLIAMLGVMEIYSTTHHTRKFDGAHIKQIYWIALSVGAMFAVSLVDYHVLMNRWPFFYMPIIVVLAFLLKFGNSVWGSKRWINVPGVGQFQVSEFIKLVIILALARYFSESRFDTVSLADLGKVGLLAGLPMALILLQPDLGTALTIVPVVAISVFLAGLRMKHVAVLMVVGALAAPAAWFLVMKPYQKSRVETFLDPSLDPKSKGYQQLQSKIAVGSGGFWGEGTAKGSQTQLSFLPVPHTDFIFAAFAEENGFFGVLGVLLLYFMVLMRLIQNAQTAPDRAGMFVVMGVLAVLLFQILVNVGMVVGYMPVVGIPLPLMSKGGSSILFTFMALGLVNNVRLRRFVN